MVDWAFECSRSLVIGSDEPGCGGAVAIGGRRASGVKHAKPRACEPLEANVELTQPKDHRIHDNSMLASIRQVLAKWRTFHKHIVVVAIYFLSVKRLHVCTNIRVN